MNALIIYAHPWEGSFNHHILERTTNLLKESGKTVDIIDLNQDGFNPVLTKSDLKLFSQGAYHDPLAKNYLERLKAADEVVLLFPIWWYGEPAILKGFYDKVLLKGHAYGEVDHALKGLLDIHKATIITTANISKEIFSMLGDPINNVLAHGIFATVGIDHVNWIHCKTVHLEASRNEFLADIDKHFSK